MYGKLFESTFTGSMYGAGAQTFAVWAYIVATAKEGCVELNPNMVANAIGMSPEEVERVLLKLAAPDPGSRNPAEEGRRIVREGRFQYRIVNHAHYRGIRNEDERREYNRKKQAEYRAKSKTKTIRSLPSVPPCIDAYTVYHSVPACTHTEAEADTDNVRGPEELSVSDKSVDLLNSSGAELENSKPPRTRQREKPDQPVAPTETPILTIATVGTVAQWHLVPSQIAKWATAFPALDIQRQCMLADAWLAANPARRKTARGMPRFLYSWLERAQNRQTLAPPGPRIPTPGRTGGPVAIDPDDPPRPGESWDDYRMRLVRQQHRAARG